MTINTKFSVNDTFWAMIKNKPQHLVVRKIQVEVTRTPTGDSYGVKEDVTVQYCYTSATENAWLFEDDCFASKEELINKLFEDTNL